MTRKLMILGGSRYLLPVIRAAHDLGAEVITCDYLPHNTAHAYADAYENISIVEREPVLAAARRLGVDGVSSFACDPGVTTAAYVAEQLGLPYACSYEVACLLQDKGRFRSFLSVHGFACPQWFVCADEDEARVRLAEVELPVVVKPLDGSGTKGVTRVDDAERLDAAVRFALEFSRAGRCIVEEFIAPALCLQTDALFVDGVLAPALIMDQIHDAAAPNTMVEASAVIPSRLGQAERRELAAELQRLATLLGVRSGLFNVEARLGTDGRLYLMEASPRGGGNHVALFQGFVGGFDYVRAGVACDLGLEPQMPAQVPEVCGVWRNEILRSHVDGTFAGVVASEEFRVQHVAHEELCVGVGEPVEAFRNAACSFGSTILHFASEAEHETYAADPAACYRVEVVPCSRL